MIHDEKHTEKTVLAHWIYTKDEWKAFMKWKKIRKSLFHFFIHWITPKHNRQIPEVLITQGKISIGDTDHCFDDERYKLKRINIFDAGSINVMEICYDSKKARPVCDIKFPVPKGKLREAISVQEKLYNNTGVL